MKRMILAALLLAAPLCAQSAPQAPQRITKLVTVKYADPNAIVSMIRMWVDVQYNSDMKRMVISGVPDNVTAAEAAIKQLDVAPKNIDLVVYFLVAGNQPAPSMAIPASLHDVLAQLKSTFAFKEYGLLDTLTLRTRTGSMAETSGVLDASTPPRMTVFSIRSATVSDDGTIRIDRMHAGLRIPVTAQSKVDYVNTGIDQSIDVKEGQKVVVGRASLAGPEKALFLILTAKVVE